MQDGKIDCYTQFGAFTVEIGDLDCRRNLKIRAFLGFVLTPVFRDLQPRLNYAEMGRRGVTPMQYYQDFQNYPAPYGYGDDFTGRYEIRLCRSVSDERRGPVGETQRVERLIVETRATLTARRANGAPAALGYQPALGDAATAGTGRVLHVLTRPHAPPGRRGVSDIPPELDFLELREHDGPYPTIPLLGALADGFAEVSSVQHGGIWGMANSDIYQHIHAREYLYAMENSVTAALSAAVLPLEAYAATRAQVIFRRPSFIGQSYALGVRLHRRGDEIVALGAFYDAGENPFANAARAAVYLRFEGRLG